MCGGYPTTAVQLARSLPPLVSLSETMSFRVFFPANRNVKWGTNLCINDRLEQESGFFFNMKYFEDQVQGGEWEEVERYLSGFTKVDDNRYSMKIFFEIRKQKYLEALDKYVFCYVIQFVVMPLLLVVK
jgi:hypothetical protein